MNHCTRYIYICIVVPDNVFCTPLFFPPCLMTHTAQMGVELIGTVIQKEINIAQLV